VRTKLRSRGNSISFFAFQDIITSVIGVVLFIALLLALFISVGTPLPETEAPRQEATQESIDQLESLLTEIRALEESLRIAMVSPMASTEIQVEALQAELQHILNQLAGISTSGPKDTASPEIQAEITKLEKGQQELQQLLEQAERRAAERRAAVAKLQQELEAVQQAKLQEAGRKNDIFLIPERAQTTKSPLLLDIKAASIDLQTLDGKHSAARSSSAGDLAKLLAGFPKSDYFVVAYFRPSTFHLAEQIMQSIRSLGYELGYDVLQEDQTVTLGNKGGS